MSGGSYNYRYADVEEEYAGHMFDAELDGLIKDLVPVLRAVEWWQSGDTMEASYREAAAKFKRKWLSGDVRQERLEQIIDGKVNDLRIELMKMIGVLDFDE